MSAHRSGPGQTRIFDGSAVTKKLPSERQRPPRESPCPSRCPRKRAPISTCSTPSQSCTCPLSPPVRISPPSALVSIDVSGVRSLKSQPELELVVLLQALGLRLFQSGLLPLEHAAIRPAESSQRAPPRDSDLIGSACPCSVCSAPGFSRSRTRRRGSKLPTARCFPSALKPTAYSSYASSASLGFPNSPQALARRGIPEPDRAVAAARRQHLAVWRHRHRTNGRRVIRHVRTETRSRQLDPIA